MVLSKRRSLQVFIAPEVDNPFFEGLPRGKLVEIPRHPPVKAPYDGSSTQRRYWKKVTEQ